MNNRYTRNRIYVTDKEQEAVRKFSVLLAGSGIGSNIAECALRFGFEKITLVDGDFVELSNLNRQNYTVSDISRPKTEALRDRLQAINPDAEINIIQAFIDENNIEEITQGHDAAVNALDFSGNIPLLFDRICSRKKIPVLHPYNFGWGGMLTVVSPNGLNLENLGPENEVNELIVAQYICNDLKSKNKPFEWLEEILDKYIAEKEMLPPPQISVGSWYTAALSTHILYLMATEKKYRKFPEYYLSSLYN